MILKSYKEDKKLESISFIYDEQGIEINLSIPSVLYVSLGDEFIHKSLCTIWNEEYDNIGMQEYVTSVSLRLTDDTYIFVIYEVYESRIDILSYKWITKSELGNAVIQANNIIAGMEKHNKN